MHLEVVFVERWLLLSGISDLVEKGRVFGERSLFRGLPSFRREMFEGLMRRIVLNKGSLCIDRHPGGTREAS